MNYVYATTRKPIRLGRRGENEATTVRFPIKQIFPFIPAGDVRFRLLYQPHGARSPYYRAIDPGEEFLEWTVASEDVASVGSGVAQIIAQYEGGGYYEKSPIFSTEVEDSL